MTPAPCSTSVSERLREYQFRLFRRVKWERQKRHVRGGRVAMTVVDVGESWTRPNSVEFGRRLPMDPQPIGDGIGMTATVRRGIVSTFHAAK